eukprot:TRINITY_DN3564_c0_g1_i1.p1 TRINITY_DN3564_c0_g1~~TRINITY_DN3564_c0_g1_i1.p1  ORF type:complete len:443 (+),score=81.87 TRINITY_DN3564_c0_g1_i1:259-1587(+)
MALFEDGSLVSMMQKAVRRSSRSSSILGMQQTCRLRDRYKLGEELGVGQFGKIRYCTDTVTGEIFACKSIAKKRLLTPEDERGVKLEIEIMSALSAHPNVVSLKAVFEEEEYVHLVMELCAGGELFDRLQEHGKYTEPEAAKLFKDLMEVLKFCHDHGVVHRDLKPENILLCDTSDSSPIKLADFGLATYFTPGEKLQGTVGSPFYIAPEILSGGYDQAVDVWSAGVILYILLSGIPPFWGKTKSKIFQAIKEADIQFPKDSWGNVSSSAKDLISKMLCTDPKKRLTSMQVLEHPWIISQLGLCQKEENQRIMVDSFDVAETEAAAALPALLSESSSEADVQVSFSNKSSLSGFLASDEAFQATSGSFAFPSCSKELSSECVPAVSNPLSFAFQNVDTVCSLDHSLALTGNRAQVQIVQRGKRCNETPHVSVSYKTMALNKN